MSVIIIIYSNNYSETALKHRNGALGSNSKIEVLSLLSLAMLDITVFLQYRCKAVQTVTLSLSLVLLMCFMHVLSMWISTDDKFKLLFRDNAICT